MAQPRRVVGIMAKAPLANQAKTRLIPLLGAEQAAQLYQHMLLDTIDLVREALGSDGSIHIVCPSAAHASVLEQLVPATVGVVAHERADLMQGLDYALTYHIEQGYKQVVLFNGDSPTLPAHYLRSAFDQLASETIVLGPTMDGGYYLIGACHPQPSLFAWEQLDSATVCDRTQERAEALGAKVVRLLPWHDVDTAEDFAQLVEELQVNPTGTPRTRHFLTQKGYL